MAELLRQALIARNTANRGDSLGEVAFGKPLAVDLGLEPGGMQHWLIAIAAGNYHTCAILGTGAIKCWGYNALGQLGLGDSTDRSTDPTQMGDALPGGRSVAARPPNKKPALFRAPAFSFEAPALA